MVVDDERAIRTFLRMALTPQGYLVFEADTGRQALADAVACAPDVIILDLGLPDMDGSEVIRRLRATSAVPVIVVSVREQESIKIAALDAGADDYLTKPFSIGELTARLRACLRRSGPSDEGAVFVSGDLRVDLARHQVTVGETRITLTRTEYELLAVLVRQAGMVLTHNQLLRAVWGTAYQAESHLLRVNISNLRRKIERDPTRPQHILTEPGIGYRLNDA